MAQPPKPHEHEQRDRQPDFQQVRPNQKREMPQTEKPDGPREDAREPPHPPRNKTV